jgi:hypothetical protein
VKTDLLRRLGRSAAFGAAVLATACGGGGEDPVGPADPSGSSLQVELDLSLDSRATSTCQRAFDSNDPATYNNTVSFSVIGTDGAAHPVSLYFRACGDEWEMTIGTVLPSPQGPVTVWQPVELRFSSSGVFDIAASGPAEVETPWGTLEIELQIVKLPLPFELLRLLLPH